MDQCVEGNRRLCTRESTGVYEGIDGRVRGNRRVCTREPTGVNKGMDQCVQTRESTGVYNGICAKLVVALVNFVGRWVVVKTTII
jgi:hypothetical protein